MATTVLVTGVSRFVGGLAARALSTDPRIERVLAVDVVRPAHDIGRAEFVRADIRNPIIGKIIKQENVDTVVHLGVITTPRQAGGRTTQKEINVIGTMQLLAACQKAPSLKRLVVKSSSAVYGSSPRDPAMFTEDMTARRTPPRGFGKDSVEVETYVRGFGRRRPDVEVCMLRMANVIGPGLRTMFSDLFHLPVIPSPVGFDGRFQVLHLDDAIGAIHAATLREDCTGVINVAGEGVLTLHQAARIAGRPTLPVLAQAGPLVQQLTARTRVGNFDAEQMDLLCFGRGMDTTAQRTVLGFTPERTTRQAFTDVFGGDNRLTALLRAGGAHA
ncbi:NAD-dependent epimerase/dehydratase family protein [Allobranchiibius sp. CTAmp26]|uniref:NAD-dependent epimerase/dehydratase family protein n=1 Tax=Allobranchiibius sp. CTAmp26 TaxID=2815214 RepID=UPI001AA140CE|nr:NAD-dependent epimerase/dehydratase family protein [Allobranchiibius sp. CTAmp26]MBO1753655.1 NAD-dependent epimerase/dehydratase family protein [Allobranchiibius sp. CTAmp26]